MDGQMFDLDSPGATRYTPLVTSGGLQMKQSDLRPMLLGILGEQPEHWWLSYSVWARLLVTHPNVARDLETAYGGVGVGGGNHYGPSTFISQTLDGTSGVEKSYLTAVQLKIGEIEATWPTMAIFRLRQG